MRLLLLFAFVLAVHYASAQPKVLRIDALGRTEYDQILTRYSDDVNNRTDGLQLRIRMDSAVTMAFGGKKELGYTLFLQCLVNAQGKADYVFFNLAAVGRYNHDSLEAELKSAVMSRMASFKARELGKYCMYNFSFMGGRQKAAPRKVPKGDSALSEIKQLLTSRDTIRIKKLFLHELSLTAVPDAIYRFPNLEELYLEKNQITSVAIDIRRLPKLSILNLGSNKITNDSLHLSRNKCLHVLNLNENSFTDIPVAVKNCRKLSSLWLAGNNMSALSGVSFKRVRKLRDLNLYKTQIGQVPAGIKKMRKLEILDLYHNKLTEIPKSVTKLKKLTHLAVAHNQLKELPEKLYKLKQLHTVYAHHNWLSYLPEKIDRLKEMRILDLGYNWFTNFPVQVTAFENLTELDMSSNNFTEFPAQLLELKHLEKLYLRGNPFIGNDAETKYASQLGSLKGKNIEVFY
ncbi:hypothetical protein DYBT9275_01239 [Dyadobacter sp. CECT 9275]|uniref:Disease resistance R13L4/SHOC-2-like LRR domain-containing protein n=1 Tax=Dyadobacter helix TaxID=2822344 RepID=A0A916J8Z4_9BACT|nr:leucine-rich repeat domain-containing protein [Dyadobacter sp. CECT 9275]CAG4993811.1 hypothetical protein DYBT9275_01239 [Dyadobacter sp. CECT 9275]